MTTESVLQELEAQFAEVLNFGGASFDQLEEYWALADARLSAFRSNEMWAVVIEAVRYDRAEEYALDVWLYGNCLQPRADFFDFQSFLLLVPPQWNPHPDPDYSTFIRREQFSVLWRGQRHDFAPSLEDLKAADIELSRRERESGELSPQQMLRFICHALDHPFFLSEDALRDLLNTRALPSQWNYDESTKTVGYTSELGRLDLPLLPGVVCELVLQTRDWRHPRADVAPEIENPVRDAFEPLAALLATGDRSAWDAQDPARFNSHWKHWAEIEADDEKAHDEHRQALIEEGERFQALLATLSDEERREILEPLQKEWEDMKQEMIQLRSSSSGIGWYGGVSYSSGGAIEFAGQNFLFGPHLWGQVDELFELEALGVSFGLL